MAGYIGKYTIKNTNKYIGNIHNITYRSLWERSFCKWCDTNKSVLKWAIEPFKIPYVDKGSGKHRKYNPDFYIEMKDGKKFVIEVKPDHETRPPKKMKRKSKRYYLAESTYMTNTSKWETAKLYCEAKGWLFRIVTEHTMKDMGIKIITTPRRKKKRMHRKIARKTKTGKNK